MARFTGNVAVVTGASKRIGAAAASSLNATVVAAVVASKRFVTRTTYVASDAFSLADISPFIIAVFLSDFIDWNAHPHLQRWFDLVKGWPGLVRGDARSSITVPSRRRTVVTWPAYGSLLVVFPRMRDP